MKKKWMIMSAILIVLGIAVCGCRKDPVTSSKNENADVKEQQESPSEYQFDAIVLEIHDEYLMVEALEGQSIVGEIKVWVGLLQDDEMSQVAIGDTVRITHDGKMTMSLPPQMNAVAPIDILE